MATEVKSSCGRQSAVDTLKSRAKELIRRGNNMLTLARALEDIEKSAMERCGSGEEGRHPYIGAGSSAEEALWELIVNVK